jgi:hypothetical protein
VIPSVHENSIGVLHLHGKDQEDDLNGPGATVNKVAVEQERPQTQLPGRVFFLAPMTSMTSIPRAGSPNVFGEVMPAMPWTFGVMPHVMPALTSSESRAENVHEVKVLAMKISKDLKAENLFTMTSLMNSLEIGVPSFSKWKAVNFWPGPTWYT